MTSGKREPNSSYSEFDGGKATVISNLWCYIVNDGYLLPALVSAAQLRQCLHASADQIAIVCICEKLQDVYHISAIAELYNIKFIRVDKNILAGHPMYCARLFVNEIFNSSQYEYVVYVDADTQFAGRVDGLVNAFPPTGSILAAPDIMSISIDHSSKRLNGCKEYFEMIGIPQNNRRIYFNTGVLKFRLSDWSCISREALAVMARREAKAFRYPDQDALNIVLDGTQTLMSFRWNYPAFFIGCGLDDIVAPSIVHFMSRPRPWDGPFQPWGRTAFEPYRAFVKAHPELLSLFRPKRAGERLRYMLQQAFKTSTEPWGTPFFRDRISQFESNALV